MQTSTTAQQGASVGLETRFNAVRAFFIDRGVRHYMSVFAAFGLDLDTRKEEITLWWNGRARLTEKDAPVIAQMEGVVERIKNEPDIAA